MRSTVFVGIKGEKMGRRRYTIKQLPPELRPRERLLTAGPSALSDGELLGLLFGIGSREKTAVELAGEVISAACACTASTTSPCRFQSQKHLALRFSVLLNEETPEVEVALV